MLWLRKSRDVPGWVARDRIGVQTPMGITFLALATFAVIIPALAMLLIFNLNVYFLMAVAWVRRRRAIRTPLGPNAPHVTVQIPLYNERYVSRRIIDAVARLDWPVGKLQIQVLDDSTDETRQIVAEHVRSWQARGVNIDLIHRPKREGYKAGALAYGLETATGDFIAIFDADFIPPPSFLRNTVPILVKEPDVAFIQTRWDHLNRRQSWLTRIQSILLDGHFAIEQFARCYGGFAFNFNGTGGVWRRSAILDAGGWQSTTLTEDLDLSYRAWVRGWRGLYRRDVTAPAELPPTMQAFRRQQARWAQGGVECARALFVPVWRSKHSLLAKVQASLHLLGYLLTGMMVLMMIGYTFLLILMQYNPESGLIFTTVNMLGPLLLAPTIFYIISQLLLRPLEWQQLVAVFFAQVIGAGMAMNTLRATLKALLGQRGEFLRTPKWGSQAVHATSYRLRADVGVLIDLLWGLYCLLVAIMAFSHGHMFVVGYATMAALGSWWVALWTIWPDVARSRRPRPARALGAVRG